MRTISLVFELGTAELRLGCIRSLMRTGLLVSVKNCNTLSDALNEETVFCQHFSQWQCITEENVLGVCQPH